MTDEARGPMLALHDLETNPDLDPPERHRLANVVRDHVDALERTIAASARKGSEVAKAMAPPGPRERSVLCWSRGSSVSFQADVVDSAWLEALHTDRPTYIRIRPEPESAKRLGVDREAAWKRGIRARVLPIHAPPEAEAGEDVKRQTEPGDWLLVSPMPRNIGGHTGRSPIATFSNVSLRSIPMPNDEGDDEEEGE